MPTKTEPIVHQQLADERGIDLQFMARAYGSSLHIPGRDRRLQGHAQFWSTEKDAFPPEAVSLLKEVVAAMHK